MNERDIRAVENMARTGMGFDDLRKAFPGFGIEDIERIYMRIRKERHGDSSENPVKMNCS